MVDLNGARERFAAIQAECDRDDLRHTAITQPTAAMTKSALYQLCLDNNAFAADIQSSLGLVWEHAAAGLAALADSPPPPPNPVLNFPAAGFYANQRYGNGARQWGNLTIPAHPRGLLVQVHGGGWMMGDPNVAVADRPERSEAVPAAEQVSRIAYQGLLQGEYYGLRQMASFAASRWNVVVWEPAYVYSTGNPDACLNDIKLSIQWIMMKMTMWGAAEMPIVYAGHSAGGQLALRAALDPTMPAPRAFLGMAAAGLTVHTLADVRDAPGGFSQGGTGWIFQTAWGTDTSKWPGYAPDTHLNERQGKFPLYIEQGNLGNGNDGSVLVRWASDFAGEAGRAGWPGEYHEQPGVDHFGVRWDQSQVTMQDMDKIWSSV